MRNETKDGRWNTDLSVVPELGAGDGGGGGGGGGGGVAGVGLGVHDDGDDHEERGGPGRDGHRLGDARRPELGRTDRVAHGHVPVGRHHRQQQRRRELVHRRRRHVHLGQFFVKKSSISSRPNIYFLILLFWLRPVPPRGTPVEKRCPIRCHGDRFPFHPVT